MLQDKDYKFSKILCVQHLKTVSSYCLKRIFDTYFILHFFYILLSDFFVEQFFLSSSNHGMKCERV